MSADDIDTQKRFSTEACRSNFLVASDPGLKIARTYDAVLLGAFANRTSYVIAPDGKVIENYTDLAPLGHIDEPSGRCATRRRSHENGDPTGVAGR